MAISVGWRRELKPVPGTGLKRAIPGFGNVGIPLGIADDSPPQMLAAGNQSLPATAQHPEPGRLASAPDIPQKLPRNHRPEAERRANGL